MDVKKSLEEANRELENLVTQKEALDRRINGLVQVIDGLKFMAQGDSMIGTPINSTLAERIEDKNVTDAVRRCLASAAGPMFPIEIRDRLWSAGYTGSGDPKSVLINVHGILDRLIKKGEVDEVPRDGQKAYKAVGALVRAIRAEKIEEIRKAKLRSAFGGVAPPPSLTDVVPSWDTNKKK